MLDAGVNVTQNRILHCYCKACVISSNSARLNKYAPLKDKESFPDTPTPVNMSTELFNKLIDWTNRTCSQANSKMKLSSSLLRNIENKVKELDNQDPVKELIYSDCTEKLSNISHYQLPSANLTKKYDKTIFKTVQQGAKDIEVVTTLLAPHPAPGRFYILPRREP
ncbi:hypothetical protein ElyMa_000139600 [Elysia marginata]|uniref:Uncharacterized protein n=1 Tax=Elysia marginata TaxID=1093978 RepID=A0AAV4ENX6_9GAST|nr:hypothetical protein ElyMa_000139600 [Elysia marginata]